MELKPLSAKGWMNQILEGYILKRWLQTEVLVSVRLVSS